MLREQNLGPSDEVKMYLTEREGATKHFKLCLQARTHQASGYQREDKDGAQSCTPLHCKGAAVPGVSSKGFGFIFIQNGRCSSEMGVESPHGAF